MHVVSASGSAMLAPTLTATCQTKVRVYDMSDKGKIDRDMSDKGEIDRDMSVGGEIVLLHPYAAVAIRSSTVYLMCKATLYVDVYCRVQCGSRS